MRDFVRKVDLFTRPLITQTQLHLSAVEKKELRSVVTRLKEIKRVYEKSERGFLSRVFHAFCNVIFKTSDKISKNIENLAGVSGVKELRFFPGVKVYNSYGLKVIGSVTSREDQPYSRLDEKGHPIEGKAFAYKQYERALPRTHNDSTFTNLQGKDFGIDDLVVAFEQARSVQSTGAGRDDKTIGSAECFRDVLNIYAQTIRKEDIKEVCEGKLLTRLLMTISHYNFFENWEEGHELLGPLSEKLDTPREVAGVRGNIFERAKDSIKAVIQSPECQAALKDFFLRAIQKRG